MMHVRGSSGGHRIATAGVSLRIAHHADHVLKRRLARFLDRSPSLCCRLIDSTLWPACACSFTATRHL